MSPGPGVGGERGSRPRSVNFTALERKFRRIWASLPSSVRSGGIPTGSSKTRATAPLRRAGAGSSPAGPRRGRRPRTTSGRTTALPASTFARSSRSLTRAESPSAALRMKPTCFSCSARQLAVARGRGGSRTGSRIVFSGERNSWLMFERKRDFSSEIRRRAFAFSSSSA